MPNQIQLIKILQHLGYEVIVIDKNNNCTGFKLTNNNIFLIKEKNPIKLLAEISYKLIEKIPNNIIAVTGTNGKSFLVFTLINAISVRASLP